jgi:hypothetical protein
MVTYLGSWTIITGSGLELLTPSFTITFNHQEFTVTPITSSKSFISRSLVTGLNIGYSSAKFSLSVSWATDFNIGPITVTLQILLWSLLATSCSITLECRPSRTRPNSPMLILSALILPTYSRIDSARTTQKTRVTCQTARPLVCYQHCSWLGSHRKHLFCCPL